MIVDILGSGGFLVSPLPLCNCKVCSYSRKLPENRRSGPSIYIHDLSLMIDTPEGVQGLIDKLKIFPLWILYSHWHPDHTLGHRVFEYLHYSCLQEKQTPTVLMTKEIKNTFEKYVSSLFYYQKKGFINIRKINAPFNLKKGIIKPFLLKNGYCYAYLIKVDKKKILICMDHCRDLIMNKEFNNVNLLITNLGKISSQSDNKKCHNIDMKNVTDFTEDNLRIIKKINPKETVLIHIEPIWNLTHDDYKHLEKKYKKYNIKFAFDGMRIDI